MSSFAPFDDARTLLLAANLVPAANIHYPNEPFTEPNPPANWLALEAYSPVLSMLDIGGGVFEERGTIRIACIAPAGSGTDSLRQLAKGVCNAFRGLSARNPFYLNAGISESSASADGLWSGLVVSIAFCYQDSNV